MTSLSFDGPPNEGWLVVTVDVDFAERAYWSADSHEGIIRLRLKPQTPGHVLPVLRDFLQACQPEMLKKALVILTESKFRLRRKQAPGA